MAFDAQRAAELHARLCADDPVASMHLAELVLEPLLARMRAKWPTTDRDEVHDVAMQSLASYLAAPHRFDPTRSSLLTWLVRDAHGDLTNAYRARQNRPKMILYADVAKADTSRNEDLAEELDVAEDSGIFEMIRATFDSPIDRGLVELMMERNRSVDAAAELMGIMDLPAEERARRVKNAKDRIRKMLKRRLES